MDIAWFSGGKNSTALLILERNNIDVVKFHDTGVELPGMVEYVKSTCNKLDLQLEITNPKKEFEEQFFKVHTSGKNKGKIWGFPYACNPCWILRDLKTLSLDKENTNLIGISYDEQHRTDRKMYSGYDVRFPLIKKKITDRDCIKLLKKHNLENPLYEYFDRTGCWLCPKQPKRSLEMLCRYFPERWATLRYYEKLSPHGFSENISLDKIERKLKQTPMINSYLM